MPGRTTSIDLTRLVRVGDAVAWNHGCAEPGALVEQFVAQRGSFGGPVDVLLLGVACSGSMRPEYADVFRFRGIGGLGTLAPLATAGLIDVVPSRYALLPDLIRERRVPVDVYFAAVSPPDEQGLVSLGPTVTLAPDCIAAARVAVAEVNPAVPWIGGDALVPLDAFTDVVHSERPLYEALAGDGRRSPVAEAICAQIAPHIRDGSTFQLGIGSIGRILPGLLADRRDLGVHAGLMADEVLELVRAGVVSRAAVAGELYCTAPWLRFADRHPGIELWATRRLLDEEVLGGLTDFVSVNGAIEVDLTGQVNAETLGGAPVGAVGGQLDLVRAAARSPGGTSIIALASTGGGRSRIVADLDAGSVTTPRHEVDLVVTEYGTADLRGRSMSERAAAMVAIAHPAHRTGLLAAG